MKYGNCIYQDTLNSLSKNNNTDSKNYNNLIIFIGLCSSRNLKITSNDFTAKLCKNARWKLVNYQDTLNSVSRLKTYAVLIRIILLFSVNFFSFTPRRERNKDYNENFT